MSEARLRPAALPEGLAGAVRLELGEVPAALATLAAAPRGLSALWSLLGATLLGADGAVPRTTKELVALAAFATARVDPLRALLRRGLEERGLDAAVLDELEAEGQSARLPERTRHVVAFGRRAAVQPAMLTDADYARLRRAGLDDAALAELVQAAGAVALLIAVSRATGAV